MNKFMDLFSESRVLVSAPWQSCWCPVNKQERNNLESCSLKTGLCSHELPCELNKDNLEVDPVEMSNLHGELHEKL